MQPDIADRILYTQVLAALGYKVQGITDLVPLRGGRLVRGVFVLGETTVTEVTIDNDMTCFSVDGYRYDVTMHANGTFDLRLRD